MKLLNLRKVKLSDADKKFFAEALSNGPKLNAAVMKWDLPKVRAAIKYERATRRRAGVLGRLAGRFKSLLAAAVDRELYEG